MCLRLWNGIRESGLARQDEGLSAEDILVCDYSLHQAMHRPAKVGDRLVSTRFHKWTGGFTAEGEPGLAICVLPGTELAFSTEVRCQGRLLPTWTRTVPHRVAIFRNVNEGQPYAYHDALEFPDGQIILLTHLRQGQRATVLQLPITLAEVRRQSSHQMEANAV